MCGSCNYYNCNNGAFQLDVTSIYLCQSKMMKKYKYRIMFNYKAVKISNCFFIQMHYIKHIGIFTERRCIEKHERIIQI